MGVPSWCLISAPVGGARARKAEGGAYLHTFEKPRNRLLLYTTDVRRNPSAIPRARFLPYEAFFLPGVVVSTAMARITLVKTSGIIYLSDPRAIFFSSTATDFHPVYMMRH